MGTCPRCGWRYEQPGIHGEVPATPIVVVEVRPDPFERRQVARSFKAAFEVGLLTTVAFWVGAAVGALVGGAFAQAIGNDPFGVLAAIAIWSGAIGLASAYGMIRLLSW